PIKRDEFQRKVEKVFSSPPPVRESMPATEPAAVSAAAPAKRMLASKRPNRFRRQLAITGVAASILAAAWGVMNYETVGYYYNQYKGHASVLPFFYVSPNEYVIKNIEKFPVEAMVPDPTLFHLPEGLFKAKAGLNDLVPALPYKADIDKNDKPVPVVTEEVVAAQTPANEEAVVEEEPTTEVPAVVAEKQESAPVLPVATQASRITATEIRTNIPAAENQKKLLPATKSFYIIAGAFKDKQNAEKLIQSLKDKQFEASFAGQTNGGLWRVSYGAFASEEAAAQQLQSIRQHENAQAWILAI
ncbi:MAG TPA: SPOR domain-containing protein, partial [Bacteroidales bacterium]|nr:SPOR domain-containing protein [Bacteroidales bacterium]